MSTTTLPILSDPTYRIESELGSGGGGVVYKAWHTRLQKHVVIKELKRGTAHDIETQRNEVEALKNVKSPYLPQVYDFLTEGERIFTVMEFIDGESLDKLLERGQKFSQPQVVKWYGQLASALEAIHKQNVCHRDIKPANVMLMPNGDLCLIDFNAALVSGNDVRLVSRSLGYASPEQFDIYEQFKRSRGAPINLGSSSVSVASDEGATTELLSETEKTELVDGNTASTELVDDAEKTEYVAPPATGNIDWKRSDVYSLGATMYHLLSGVHPPMRASEVVAISKVGGYSEGVVFVIEQSMKLSPTERFASAAALLSAVADIHKHDTRWRVAQAKKLAAAIVLPVLLAGFAATTLLGVRTMVREKEELYYATVYEIENGASSEQSFADALLLFPERIDAYYARAKTISDSGDFEACREFIEKHLGTITLTASDEGPQEDYGNIHYLLGNCYFEAEDYHNAVRFMEIAVTYVAENPTYYRDYAIALTRIGDTEQAKLLLEKARALNLDEDSLHLLEGEIAYAEGRYDGAFVSLSAVVAMTTDDYIRYRAYHTMDEICVITGDAEQSASLLNDALLKIPPNRVNEFKERLAAAYIRLEDFASAAELLEALVDGGARTFRQEQNLVVLYQNLREHDKAAALLADMRGSYPNDYRVPMRQAFLAADMQADIANERRDYTATEQYYDEAVALYEANVKPGESDPEMQMLEDVIAQLTQQGWLK